MRVDSVCKVAAEARHLQERYTTLLHSDASTTTWRRFRDDCVLFIAYFEARAIDAVVSELKTAEKRRDDAMGAWRAMDSDWKDRALAEQERTRQLEAALERIANYDIAAQLGPPVLQMKHIAASALHVRPGPFPGCVSTGVAIDLLKDYQRSCSYENGTSAGMRHPDRIATDMENLAGVRGDHEFEHGRADDLLIELIEVLCPSREQAPPTWAAVRRTVAAWRRCVDVSHTT